MHRSIDGNCEHCGVFRVSLHRDHIVPKYKGGPDSPENIQYLCANCHEDKTREDMTGRVVTPSTRMKLSQSHLGILPTESTRKRHSVNRRGVKHSTQWSNNISKSLKGHPVSAEARLKMSLAKKGKPSNRLGCKNSPEQNEKHSQSMLGRIPWNKGLRKSEPVEAVA